jgi:hypothetical protein
MKKPAVIKVVRRAYHLWEKAGKPEGRDQEFYHQAERELEGEPEDDETPEDTRPSRATPLPIDHDGFACSLGHV